MADDEVCNQQGNIQDLALTWYERRSTYQSHLNKRLWREDLSEQRNHSMSPLAWGVVGSCPVDLATGRANVFMDFSSLTGRHSLVHRAMSPLTCGQNKRSPMSKWDLLIPGCVS